jgi:hypothetical protein
MGLPVECRRVVGLPRCWAGLRADDATLLAAWLGGLAEQPDELYTGVPVGPVPKLDGKAAATAVGAGYLASCAWRVDAVVRFGADWWLLECKPGAMHYTIGQVLFYRHWWGRTAGYPELAVVAIVSDLAEPDIVPVCREYGIVVVEVGEVLEYPRRRGRLRGLGQA